VADRRDVLARELPGDALREAAAVLAAARAALAPGIDARERARAHEARAEDHAAAEDRAQAEAAAARDAREIARRELYALRPAIEEAARARDLARAVLDLSRRRAELDDGEACPLCGSLEHPYRTHAPGERLAEAQELRVAELREKAAEAERAAARAAAMEEAAEREAAAAESATERELEGARACELVAGSACDAPAMAAVAAIWELASPQLRALLADRELVRASVGPGGALSGGDAAIARPAWADPPEPSELVSRASALDEVRARVDAALAEREPAQRALDAAIEERETARAARDAAAAACREAESALDAASARSAEVSRLLASHADERAAILARLQPARACLTWAAGHVGLDRALETDAAALAARLAKGLDACRGARRTEESARSAKASLAPSIAQARAAVARALEEHVAARAAYEEVAATAAEAAAHRARLAAEHGGSDPDVIEARARDAIEAARRSRDEALSVRAKAREARAAAACALETAERSERAGRKAREASESRLAFVLEQALLDEAAARSLLSRGETEIAAWRRDLDDLDARRAKARAVLAERERRRERHASDAARPRSAPDELGTRGPAAAVPSRGTSAAAIHARERLDADISKARELEDAARALLAGAQQRIVRDDELRTSRASALAELEGSRARVRTWAALDEAIGSADGKRFRVFAQGLTLELLLETANVHLGILAPRYALERTPGTELGIQVVDRELGDEIRGVRSLSGGETFLVSLALALALGSMTSRRVRLGTLFIDEGFGGLDAESLDVVLSALDALQATGCQVGVISHVAAMAERFAARVEVTPRGRAESVVRVVS
jgi:exonuclease SbcC